jgi:putative endonuclease
VRYRARADRARLAATIDHCKQRRIARATLHFLQRHRAFAERPVRFDVALISGPLARPQVDWLADAFDADG